MTTLSQPGQLVLRGASASPGLAAGTILRMEHSARAVPESAAGSPDEESRQLREALTRATSDLSDIMAGTADTAAAEMIEFQIAMLEDESLTEPTFAAIGHGNSAAAAWRTALEAEIEVYRGSDEEYFRARTVDLEDIRDRVIHHLLDNTEATVPPGSIIVCDELNPSTFLQHREHIAGIAMRRGSSSGHVAILARAQGLPILIGLEECEVESGSHALLDARAGTLTLRPTREALARFETRQASEEHDRRTAEAYLHTDARLPNGERVQVLINLADPKELDHLDATTCDGVGLVRTEFLFHARSKLPDEDEQLAVYARIVRWADGRPVTIRTLDAGGDKPIPGLTIEGELNPFLGVRGLRLSLRRPEVFETQIRALLRAARIGTVKVMLPMVTEPWELEQARRLIVDAFVDLGGGRGEPLPFALGIMVEVPACAVDVTRFEADFYSIGSNDLLQYLTACGRDSGELEMLARPDNPAMLSMIQDVVAKAGAHDRGVSLCGDMAADPCFLSLLLDRGLRSVSVAPTAVARTKAAVASHGGEPDG